MKFYVAKQGETLYSIYSQFYGKVDLGCPIDEDFNYFATCNLHILTISPIACVGGEIVILPTQTTASEPVEVTELGN